MFFIRMIERSNQFFIKILIVPLQRIAFDFIFS